MANGISQLEQRNWNFKNDVSVIGTLQVSPGRFVLEEYFKRLPQLNVNVAISTSLDFEVLGTNADNTTEAYSTTVAGVKLTTKTTSADQVIVLPHLDTAQTAWSTVLWGTENQTVWECALRTDSSIASIIIWAGLKLTNTSTIATDADQVLFRFSTTDSDTTWRLISSIGNSDTNTDSGVTVAASTTYRFKVSIDSDRKATFYINDVAYYKTAALTNDVDLIPYVGVQTATTAAKAITVCYEKISRILFE